MPQKFVGDPQYEIGASPERVQIVEKVRAEKGEKAVENLVNLSKDLLQPFAVYGHGYIQTILQDAKELSRCSKITWSNKRWERHKEP